MTDPHEITTPPSRRRAIKNAAALAAGVAAPAIRRIGPALAAYPDRPVRLVVPNAPGGISDIVARLLAVSPQQAMGYRDIITQAGIKKL